MTCRGDSLSPQISRRFKLRQYEPCHIHKSPVLPLRYTILLRVIGIRILMKNSLFTKKII
jgi:hypothetical protein